MITRHSPALLTIAYAVLLIAISGVILLIFVRPGERHSGLNQYDRGKFLDMVEGTAYKPFVSRTLLPTAVRIVSTLTPSEFRRTFSVYVVQHRFATTTFKRFSWETSAAYEYSVALFLMLLCFMGFAHYSAKLTFLVCDMRSTFLARSLLAALVLIGLPPFFKYASYLYDPSQLLMFTLALYFLASCRMSAFVVAFGLCCLNKETAVLLIPVYALTCGKRGSQQRYLDPVLYELVLVYVATRSLLAYVFRSNPGAFLEFRSLRNIQYLMGGWTFADVTVFLVLVGLLFYRWNEKPAFLRLSFVCVAPPLFVLSLFLGFVDEWRAYYEVYPIAFGLAVDSAIRLKSVFYRDRVSVQQRGPAGKQ
jgi:hypothetical protein